MRARSFEEADWLLSRFELGRDRLRLLDLRSTCEPSILRGKHLFMLLNVSGSIGMGDLLVSFDIARVFSLPGGGTDERCCYSIEVDWAALSPLRETICSSSRYSCSVVVTWVWMGFAIYSMITLGRKPYWPVLAPLTVRSMSRGVLAELEPNPLLNGLLFGSC